MFDDIRPHLVELRKRLVISVATLIIMFFIMFSFSQELLTWLVQPLNDALISVGKQSLTDGTANFAIDGKVTTNQIGGAFFVAMTVSFFAALIASLPIILAQIWLFVAPALYANEKKLIIPFVVGGTVMFTLGAAFAYYVVTPFGFDFLIAFGSFKFTPLINIEDYVGFFTKIMFGFGIAFELPIFAYGLAILGLVNDKQMMGFFRYAIVIIFVVSAILTPPEVLTQTLMAVPLVVLYGVSIIIVRFVNPAEEEEEDEDEEDKEEPLAIENDSK